MHTPPAQDNVVFPSTRWSVVVAAGHDSEEALQQLAQIYWPPLVGWARRSGRQQADAEDAVQDFFFTLLRRRSFARAEAERGRFRSFLLSAFRNHLRDQHAYATAACRDRRRLIDIDAARWDMPAGDDEQMASDQAFDADWARTVLDVALAELETACEASGHMGQYRVLRPFLTSGEVPDIGALAEELGMKTGATKVALHRLRAQWRDILRARVADTLCDSADIDAELRHLLAALAARESS